MICDLCMLQIKISEQESTDTPNKCPFPSVSPKQAFSMFLVPSHWGNVPKARSPFLFYTWRLSTLKISLPLVWIVPLLRREEKVVTRVLWRVQLGEKLVFLYLFSEWLPKSPPGLLICLLYVSHSQPTFRQAIGEQSVSKHCQLCLSASGKISYFKICCKCYCWSTTALRIHYLPVLSALSGVIAFSSWLISCHFGQPLF